jgi:tetratricopeptide (TPR) repeat protein
MKAMVHSAWGQMYDLLGNVERATEQYHKALHFAKSIYDLEAEANLCSLLSSILERVGNLKKATKYLSRAMTIHYDLRLLELWAEDNVRLARIAGVRGKPELGLSYLAQARQMYQQLGNKQKLEEFGVIGEKDVSTITIGEGTQQ